jgi:hypothetical protein
MNGAKFGRCLIVDVIHLQTLWAEFPETLPIVILTKRE